MSMQMKGGLNCTIRTGEVIFSFPREFPEAGKVKLPPWLSFSVSICLFFSLKLVVVGKMHVQPVYWVHYWHCLHLGEVLCSKGPFASPDQLHGESL